METDHHRKSPPGTGGGAGKSRWPASFESFWEVAPESFSLPRHSEPWHVNKIESKDRRDLAHSTLDPWTVTV